MKLLRTIIDLVLLLFMLAFFVGMITSFVLMFVGSFPSHVAAIICVTSGLSVLQCADHAGIFAPDTETAKIPPEEKINT